MIGIYAEPVKAHIPDGVRDDAGMPKSPMPEARRPLTRSDYTAIANVARLMKQHGVIGNNQSELARKAKVDQTFISKFLKRKNSISVSYLHKIASALGVETWQLLVSTDWPLSNPPVLVPLTDTERRLYAKLEEVKAIAAEVAREAT